MSPESILLKICPFYLPRSVFPFSLSRASYSSLLLSKSPTYLAHPSSMNRLTPFEPLVHSLQVKKSPVPPHPTLLHHPSISLTLSIPPPISLGFGGPGPGPGIPPHRPQSPRQFPISFTESTLNHPCLTEPSTSSTRDCPHRLRLHHLAK